MLACRRLLDKAGRPAELLLAAVFLAGALLKAWDINLFIVQISHYGVLSDRTFISFAALATVGLETALAVALLLKIRLRGLTCAGILGLLAGFTGLILYGWFFHDLKDCGCFGPIEISPGASVAKNGVLALLAVAAWMGAQKDAAAAAGFGRFIKLAPIALVAAGAVAGYSYSTVETIPPPEARRFAEFVFEDEDGVVTDLGQGEYLVVILSAECDHCIETVPLINELVRESDVPETVGLCYEPRLGDLDEFRDATVPEFPVFSIGDSVGKFFSLIGSEPPRFILVRDGMQVHYWDDKPPTPAEIVEARRSKPNRDAT